MVIDIQRQDDAWFIKTKGKKMDVSCYIVGLWQVTTTWNQKFSIKSLILTFFSGSSVFPSLLVMQFICKTNSLLNPFFSFKSFQLKINRWHIYVCDYWSCCSAFSINLAKHSCQSETFSSPLATYCHRKQRTMDNPVTEKMKKKITWLK